MTELSDAQRVASINDMSARVIRGEQVSDEELAAAIRSLRTSRGVAAAVAPAAKKKAKAAVIPLDLNDLFGSGI